MKYFTEVRYASWCYFFARKSALVAVPPIAFTCMAEKVRWFTQARATLRLTHLGDKPPSTAVLTRRSRFKTLGSTAVYKLLQLMHSSLQSPSTSRRR